MQQITPHESIEMKVIGCNQGVPRITWTEEEVQKMNVIEELQLAVIGKYSYSQNWKS